VAIQPGTSLKPDAPLLSSIKIFPAPRRQPALAAYNRNKLLLMPLLTGVPDKNVAKSNVAEQHSFASGNSRTASFPMRASVLAGG